MGIRKTLIVAGGAAILLLVVFLLYARLLPSQQLPPSSQIVTPTPMYVIQSVSLNEQNNSSESGRASFKEVNGQVTLTLELTGAPKEVSQPAHIHMGSCSSLGDVKYPLTSLADGRSETVLNVTLKQLNSEQPLAINVHRSAANIQEYVSCADLPIFRY